MPPFIGPERGHTMRRLWLVGVMTIGSASGCGTMFNLTDIDGHGRDE